MPVVRRRLQAAPEHALRTVLAALVFVADDRHLGVEVLLRDERIHHPVGFHRERPVEILVGGGERLEIVGAVEERRAVETRSAAAELLEDARNRRRALEQQVLEQMRHARLAVVLLARAHEIRNVDGRRRLGGVGKQEHLQAVRKRVLGDPFDRRPLGDAGGQRRLGGAGEEREKGGGEKPGGVEAEGEGHGYLDDETRRTGG